MADYADYLRNVALPQGAATLDVMYQTIQEMKNRAAPRVSGGGGSGGSSGGGTSSGTSSGGGSYSGPIKIGKMGGKVLPTASGAVNQNWGKSNISYGAGRHTGIDFKAAYGTRVRAAANGVVVRTGGEGAYGNAVHIRHKDGTTSFYAHLSGIAVKAGQTVKSGQWIGKSGATGRAFGPHLHFEIRKQDRYGGDINPRSWYSTR